MQWRARRDERACRAALDALAAAARNPDLNLMPAILAAADADGTVGEICAALQSVFGGYKPAVTL